MNIYDQIYDEFNLHEQIDDDIPFYNGRETKIVKSNPKLVGSADFRFWMKGINQCCQAILIYGLYFREKKDFLEATKLLLEYMKDERINEPCMILYDNGSYDEYLKDSPWVHTFTIPADKTASGNEIKQWTLLI